MAITLQARNSAESFRSATAAPAIVIAFALAMMLAQGAQAQTFQVIHQFTGAGDGGFPLTGLTMDSAGNFYGAACLGGHGYGTIFKLWQVGGGWRITPLYTFQGGYDGSCPHGRVIFGPDGSLYGTTYEGGGGCSSNGGCGTVFRLTPPASVCKAALCPWTETVLYRAAADDGEELWGEVVFDQAGNLYSTVALGGPHEGGYVFELTPNGNNWTSQILYAFNLGNGDCNAPDAGLVFDSSGNLYGTADDGGMSNGAVFQLTPSGSGWTENILFDFNGLGDGDGPEASLLRDGYGNLYGTTFTLGPHGGGTVFELTPSGGGWTFSMLYAFTFFDNNGSGLLAPMSMDANGNLYSTTFECEECQGTVFQLTPGSGGWTRNVLYRFSGGDDGGLPHSSVLIDSSGNLYGTASSNGDYGQGVIWEITP